MLITFQIIIEIYNQLFKKIQDTGLKNDELVTSVNFFSAKIPAFESIMKEMSENFKMVEKLKHENVVLKAVNYKYQVWVKYF